MPGCVGSVCGRRGCEPGACGVGDVLGLPDARLVHSRLSVRALGTAAASCVRIETFGVHLGLIWACFSVHCVTDTRLHSESTEDDFLKAEGGTKVESVRRSVLVRPGR